MIVYANGRVSANDVNGETQPIGAVGPNSDSLKVADDESRDYLYNIIKELRIMNMHLSLLTDVNIEHGDIDNG